MITIFTMQMTKSDDRPHEPASEPLRYATDFHAPALWREVVSHLVTEPTGTYVDATLGGGGHSAALLTALDTGGRVVGIDQDAEAVDAATHRLQRDVEAGRFQAIRGNFREIERLLDQHHLAPVDGLLLDLGVSSHQINTPDRGFSYRAKGGLDMRMDQRGGITAGQVINQWSAHELRQALYDYGEESRARQVVRAILSARPLRSTTKLAEVIRGAVPTREEVSTLSRVFQALRIAVNRELDALEEVLRTAPHVLRAGGRMAVISYHSLEDRRVKRFFRYGNREGKPVRDLYGNRLTPWNEITHKPIRPTEEEVEANARARSARLRVAERKEEVPDQEAGWV